MGWEIDYLVGRWLVGDSRGEFLMRFLGESSEFDCLFNEPIIFDSTGSKIIR